MRVSSPTEAPSPHSDDHRISTLGSRDAESLFRTKPIAEIRKSEAAMRKQIEDKKEELRQLVEAVHGIGAAEPRRARALQGGGRHLFYDAFNRLAKVDRSFDGGLTFRNVGNYTYDASGRRVTKKATVFNATGGLIRTDDSVYILDGATEIQEWDAMSQALLSLYVWGGAGEPGPTQQVVKGNIFFPLGDAQNSTAAIISVFSPIGSAPPVLERYEYTNIYGKHIVHLPGPVGGIGPVIPINAEIGNPYRFQGRRFDDESGLYYLGKRYLDPELGRFLTPDPNGIWGDRGNLGNPYAFVGNNPFNRRDPFGL